MKYDFSRCTLCPRECKADRTKTFGICGESHKISAALAQLHFWEEPCLSGKKGSGAIFFSGCSLKCCFCQNSKISSEGFGASISEKRLGEIMLELQEKGAHNINLVNPTHFVPRIINALELIKDKLYIPVIYNSGGYEKPETLRLLYGLIDIYLPDFKYMDKSISRKYSKAANYSETAIKALCEMHRQQPKLHFDKEGMLKKGLIIRHLVLPGCRHDSIEIIGKIHELLPKDSYLLSLMSQYTPNDKIPLEYKNLHRRVTTFEYERVLEEVNRLEIKGYCQSRSSAEAEYTPIFDLSGIVR